MAITAVTRHRLTRFAHFPSSTEDTMPANMERMMEKNGKFCTNSIYRSSFRYCIRISSMSSEPYL